MLVKRWKLTGSAAALLLGLLAARPAAAGWCGVDWGLNGRGNGDDNNSLTVADVNGDAVVNGLDLGVLLGEWTDEDEDCQSCRSDFNGDQKVGCVDMEFLLGNWGECQPPEDLDGLDGVGCGDLQVLLDALPLCTTVAKWDVFGESGDPYAVNNAPSFDVDNNGIVNEHDVNMVRCLFGPVRSTPPQVDFNGDWMVNEADVDFVERALGLKCPDPSQDGQIGWPDVYVLIKRWK